jgi:predicted metal-dependent phosphoesterase TrpH
VAKADLHVHTRESDGLAPVEAVLEYAEHQTDLDVIAITDHEDARGGHRAREIAARSGMRLEVIVGAEVTTLQGHLLALFIEECPKSFRSIERTLEEIHRQGGLAIVPHPGSWLTRSVSPRTVERVQRRAEPGVTFDAIETCNPSPAGRQAAPRALELAGRWHLPVAGGSDAHHLVHVASGWTAFAGSGAEGVRDALRTGGTRAAMSGYPGLREVGFGRVAAGLAWGYAATPRKLVRGVRTARHRPRPAMLARMRRG